MPVSLSLIHTLYKYKCIYTSFRDERYGTPRTHNYIYIHTYLHTSLSLSLSLSIYMHTHTHTHTHNTPTSSRDERYGTPTTIPNHHTSLSSRTPHITPSSPPPPPGPAEISLSPGFWPVQAGVFYHLSRALLPYTQPPLHCLSLDF